MLEIKIHYKEESSIINFDKDEIYIGKSSDCDIQIKGWLVTQKHSIIKHLPAGYVVEDLDRGANGTYVNDKKIEMHGPLAVGDKINIGKYQFEILTINNQPVQNEKWEKKSKDTVFPNNEKNNSSFKETIETGLSIYKNSRAEKDKEIKLMKELHDKLIEDMDLQRNDISKMSDEELYSETLKCLDRIIDNDLTIERSNI